MAAPMSTMWCRSLRNILGRFGPHRDIKSLRNSRHLSSGNILFAENKDGSAVKSRDPGQVFLEERVQQLLYRVNHFNVDKIFTQRAKSDIEPPQYRLLTDNQLEEEQKEAIERARERLKMPPVMKARSDEVEIISDDKDIAGHDTVKYVFTDITFGLKDRERTMVVREPGGVLRTVTPEERDRLQLIYLRPEGRMHRQPQMFEGDNLERMLQEGQYEYILERACLQFEPDDPEYIRVTHRTYEHVDATGAYDLLDSTRHYGVMTFYLSFNQKIDGLILHKIKLEEIAVAADLVRLHHVIHPDSASKTSSPGDTDDLTLLENYIKHDARKKAELELALQSYKANRPQAARA